LIFGERTNIRHDGHDSELGAHQLDPALRRFRIDARLPLKPEYAPSRISPYRYLCDRHATESSSNGETPTSWRDSIPPCPQ
jgi:hypothetical protein